MPDETDKQPEQKPKPTAKKDPLIATRSEFNAKSEADKQAFVKAHGTVTEDPDYAARVEAQAKSDAERVEVPVSLTPTEIKALVDDAVKKATARK